MNDINETLKRIEKFVLLQAKEALSVDDLILLTGFKRQTIYNLVSQKKIPCYKSHGLHFKKSEINEWLLSDKQKTDDEINQQALLTTL